jgi:hypothetical protein
MAVRLLGMAEELDPEVQHKIAHRVRDPQATVITETTGEFAIGAESPRADWLTGIVLSMVVLFEVAAEGVGAAGDSSLPWVRVPSSA